MPSCVQHDVHDPQSPIAVNTMSLCEAIASISRASRWKVSEPGQLEEGGRHYVEFQYRLDTSQLPRPMQIGISGEPDWQLLVKRTLRIN